MIALLVVVCIVLFAVIAVQIGKVTELAGKIRGEEEVQEANNSRQGIYSMVFVVVFLIGCIASAGYYKNWMLGYGPHEAASAHGGSLDYLFDVTLFFTGIVFVITQILLFYFAYKYQGKRGRKALYMPHDNRLEVIWTVVPAVVMTFLVVGGLDAWNEVMADVSPDEDFVEIEATGMQFAWLLRYPGADGKLGKRDYTMISGNNPLGQDWKDEKNVDDFHPSEIVLPVNKKVRVRITARDVLHNFYLPHFRVKMDAVPGMPTYFVFTPTKTTEEYRQELRNYPEYNKPVDPSDPESPMMWEAFEYELACAELCGSGHFSMRRIVRIVSEGEYQDWLDQQQSYYLSTIRNSDSDPFKGELFDFEVRERRQEFNNRIEEALSSTNDTDKTLALNNVFFETGKSSLTGISRYELDNLVETMEKYPNLTIELSGHTDNTGEPDANQVLSEDRAKTVYDYLTGKGVNGDRLTYAGFGQTRPVASNDSEDGRAQNRRIEFKILTQ